MVGRGQHHTIAYNPENGPLRPQDLNGKRVGVRAYSVTTATWVRGILARDYGVDLDSIKWVTFEDPHVAEYKDPPTATRAPAGKELAKMLLDGELDAAVVGDKLPDPRLKTLIPDAENVGRAWAAKNGGVPINHMAVVRDTIVKSRPDVVKEIYRLLLESKRAAKLPTDGTPDDPLRFGIEPNRKALEVIIDMCVEQKLIARRFTVDELFQDTSRSSGFSDGSARELSSQGEPLCGEVRPHSRSGWHCRARLIEMAGSARRAFLGAPLVGALVSFRLRQSRRRRATTRRPCENSTAEYREAVDWRRPIAGVVGRARRVLRLRLAAEASQQLLADQRYSSLASD